MPRPSLVPAEDAIAVLKRYINNFASDAFPEHASSVWKEMSEEPEFCNKWNPKAVRTNVREDRRNILTRAREECGIFIEKKEEKNVDYKNKMIVNYYDHQYCPTVEDSLGIERNVAYIQLKTPENMEYDSSEENATFLSDTETDYIPREVDTTNLPTQDSFKSSKKENESDLKQKEIELENRKLALKERRLALEEAKLELKRQESLQRLKFEEREKDVMFSLLKGQKELISLFLKKCS